MTNEEARMKNEIRIRKAGAGWMRASLLRHSVFLICSGFGILLSSFAASPSPDKAADWQPAPETIVLFNRSFEGSEELARYYASKRQIPEDRLVGLKCAKEETISRDVFESEIRGPLLRTFQ